MAHVRKYANTTAREIPNDSMRMQEQMRRDWMEKGSDWFDSLPLQSRNDFVTMLEYVGALHIESFYRGLSDAAQDYRSLCRRK